VLAALLVTPTVTQRRARLVGTPPPDHPISFTLFLGPLKAPQTRSSRRVRRDEPGEPREGQAHTGADRHLAVETLREIGKEVGPAQRSRNRRSARSQAVSAPRCWPADRAVRPGPAAMLTLRVIHKQEPRARRGRTVMGPRQASDTRNEDALSYLASEHALPKASTAL
jgi:hypothetical protein